MIVTIHRDGQHVADLKIDDMRDWAEVCEAIRERMFPDIKVDHLIGPGPMTVVHPVPPKRRRK